MSVIILFLEAWHDWRMAKNIESLIINHNITTNKFMRIQWNYDHEQRTKMIKSTVFQLIHVDCWILWGWWWTTPLYWGLRFLLFDLFYYSFEKGRVFFFSGSFKADLKEWFDRHTLTYWAKYLWSKL
jgi:hypothetical protein